MSVATGAVKVTEGGARGWGLLDQIPEPNREIAAVLVITHVGVSIDR